MSFRIIIYEPQRWAENEEVLSRVAAATGSSEPDPQLFRAPSRTARIEPLSADAARQLVESLETLGVEVEMEAPPDSSSLEWLTAEAPKWVRRGLVHPASLPPIFANYDLEPPAVPGLSTPAAKAAAKPVGPATLLKVVLGFGAILIGTGLLLFVAANWQRIPPQMRIGGVLLTALLALHWGERLREAPRSRRSLGGALLAIAFFAIGGVVALIGQVYHLLANTYVLPLIWGGLGSVMGVLLRFRPAMVGAHLLWFGAFLLYHDAYREAPWFYPVLLLVFLVPHSVVAGDLFARRFHLVMLGVALVCLVAMEAFWPATVLVVGLAVYRYFIAKAHYDWALVGAFALWHLLFLREFDTFPNVFYLIPLAYFFWRAWRSSSNSLMSVTAANTWMWLTSFLAQINERLELVSVSPLDALMWLLSSGILAFGAGLAIKADRRWASLATFLRVSGGGLVGLAVYALSFRFYESETSFYDSPLAFAGSLALGVLGVALGAVSHFRGASLGGGTLVIALSTALAWGACFVVSPSLAVLVVFFNLILFAAALVFLVRGQRKPSLVWFNVGIGLFLVMVVSRYLDTFVAYLPRSIFFVLGGLFLIGWAILVDRLRKHRGAAA